MSCTLAPHVDIAIVCVADESVPAPRELVVELAPSLSVVRIRMKFGNRLREAVNGA